MNAPLPINLMLVEDERVIAFDLKNQLQSFGYRVGAVLASGEQAVHRVAEVAPDLVLMDIHLEGPLDGIEAALQIQTRHRVPVVFLTAYAEDDTLRRALDCRPFGYLVKPCEARELHANCTRPYRWRSPGARSRSASNATSSCSSRRSMPRRWACSNGAAIRWNCTAKAT